MWRTANNLVLAASTLAALSTLVALYAPQFLSTPSLSNSNSNSGDLLLSAHPINLTAAFGPESLAFDPTGAGPYTGVADGRILKWDPLSLSWIDFAATSPNRKECTRPFAPELEHVCGRPLGLRFELKSGDLYIADAYFGLHVVGPEGGLASKLVTEAEDQPLYFTNDLDIDEDEDIIYFTDSSMRFRRRQFMQSILNGDKTGRFMKYNKSTKQVTVLLRDLAFANGVALSKDRSFVLIAETRTCRILRYWIKGENAGKVETFADLPGYPDNIRRNSRGEFWVAVHGKKTPFADWLLRNIWAAKALLKVPLRFDQLHLLFMGKHHAITLKLSPEGEGVQVLEDSEGQTVRYISEVEERDGKLFVGSVMMPSIWVYNLD